MTPEEKARLDIDEKLIQAGWPIQDRNNLKHLPVLDTTGFRDCQIRAIRNPDVSFAEKIDLKRRGTG